MKILLIAAIHWPDLWDGQQERERAESGRVDTPLVVGQGQYFWWKALREMGHDVHVHRYTDPLPDNGERRSALTRIPRVGARIRRRRQRLELAQINDRIVSEAKTIDPDVILVSGGSGFLLATTISELRSAGGARLAHLNGTSPVVFSDAEARRAAPFYDCIFTNDRFHAVEWLELGAPKALALPVSGCDHDYHRRVPSDEEVGVGFIGRVGPPRLYEDRVSILESVADLDLGIWSDDEEVILSNPRLRPCYKGRAHREDMLRAISSARIVLNSHGRTMQGGGNMRLFETAALGAAQVADRCDPAWFTEDKEILIYKDLEDLRRKVLRMLDDDGERKCLGDNARSRALGSHTYGHRMQRLLDVLLDG